MTVELSTFITCDNNVGSNKHFCSKKVFTTYGHMEIHTYNTYSILNKDLLIEIIMLSLYNIISLPHVYTNMYMM